MDIQLVRRARVLKLIEEEHGNSRAAFAKRIERDDSYVSQLLALGGKNRRNIGEKIARHIEEKHGKPRGWLDQVEGGAHTAQQTLQIYSLTADSQAKLLTLFDQLTPPQQEEFMQNIAAAVDGNVATFKHMSKRLRGVKPEKAAAHLPPAPKEKQR